MSANKIQIKRSTTNAVVTGLSNGELAFTQASNVLFIGLPDGSGVAPIGGVRYPGTLTANQALVANASSAIDKVIVANAVITYLTANGVLGVASQVLSTNSSGGIYWRDGGSLGTNVDAQYTWTNTHTFSNVITFNANALFATANATTFTAAVYGDASGGFKANATFIGVGNSSVAASINSTSFSGTANNALYLGGTLASSYATQSYVTGLGYITSAALSGYATESYVTSQGYLTSISGSGNTAYDSSRLGGTAAANFVQNTDSRTLSGNLYLTGANTGFSTGYFVGAQPGTTGASVSSNTTAILIGNSSINATINSTAFTGSANSATYLGGNTALDLRTYSETTAGNAYTWAMANTLSRNDTYTGNNIFSGANNRFTGDNTTVTGFLTTANADLASVKVRTSKLISGSYDRNEIDLAAGDKLIISGGNYGLDLRSSNNGSDWFTLNLNANNGALVPSTNGTMNLGTTTNRFGTLYLSGSTITLGNTSLSDEDVGGLTVTNMNVTSAFTSSGNTKLGDSTSDVVSFAARVNTSIVPSANITYNLGTIDLRYDKVFGSNVVSEYINVGKDLTVSGNLYVTGTVAYINTTSFSTTDTLLQFASNNNVTDILDIGFFGEYSEASTTKYTGLFRDASDGTYALFTGLTDAPAGTVNTGDASFAYASLKTYITSSALVANSTQTNITANSSVSVAVTANTLNFDKIDAGTF